MSVGGCEDDVGASNLPSEAPRVPPGDPLYNDVLDFLYEEAELLDDTRLDEWLNMMDEGLSYRMPVRLTVARGATSTGAVADPPHRTQSLGRGRRGTALGEGEGRVLGLLLALEGEAALAGDGGVGDPATEEVDADQRGRDDDEDRVAHVLEAGRAVDEPATVADVVAVEQEDPRTEPRGADDQPDERVGAV